MYVCTYACNLVGSRVCFFLLSLSLVPSLRLSCTPRPFANTANVYTSGKSVHTTCFGSTYPVLPAHCSVNSNSLHSMTLWDVNASSSITSGPSFRPSLPAVSVFTQSLLVLPHYSKDLTLLYTRASWELCYGTRNVPPTVRHRNHDPLLRKLLRYATMFRGRAEKHYSPASMPLKLRRRIAVHFATSSYMIMIKHYYIAWACREGYVRIDTSVINTSLCGIRRLCVFSRDE